MVCLRGTAILANVILEWSPRDSTPDVKIHRVSGRSLATHMGYSHLTEPCPNTGCLIIYLIAAGLVLAILVAVFGVALHARMKLRKAITAGSIPASMLMSRWNIAANERGDVDAFAFPVSRPASRAAVNEDCCPVCLGTTPKAANWVVFGACGHATCVSCFKKLASRYRLHSACPLCRKLLATGEGARGDQKKRHMQEQAQEVANGQTSEAATATAAPGFEPPRLLQQQQHPDRDDNV